MTRVSTAGLYATSVAAINTAQDRLNTAARQANSGKLATDLSGYASSDEQITAAKTLQSRIQSYLDNNKVLTSKLDLQDQTLQTVATSASSAKTAITQALAAGDGTSLLTQLQGSLSDAVTALNTQFNGQYVFAGSQTSTPPVSISQLTDLTTPAATASIASVFKNDQLAPVTRIEDNAVVTTGQLASTVGTPLFSALQQIAAFNQGPNGPITGTLTPAQTTFLQGVIASFTTAETKSTSAVVQNGAVQQQLANVNKNLSTQSDTLTQSLGNLTDVDIAKAASDLQLAQFAMQASAKVFGALSSSNLLNLLPNTFN
jgi:flagellar hook-associated protein 3 FlgL